MDPERLLFLLNSSLQCSHTQTSPNFPPRSRILGTGAIGTRGKCLATGARVSALVSRPSMSKGFLFVCWACTSAKHTEHLTATPPPTSLTLGFCLFLTSLARWTTPSLLPYLCLTCSPFVLFFRFFFVCFFIWPVQANGVSCVHLVDVGLCPFIDGHRLDLLTSTGCYHTSLYYIVRLKCDFIRNTWMWQSQVAQKTQGSRKKLHDPYNP